MKWSLFIVLVFLESTVFGEEQETFSMETDVNNRNLARNLKSGGVTAAKDTSAISSNLMSLDLPNIDCGLRPKSTLDRRLDSFQEDDNDDSGIDGEDKILGGNFASFGEIPWQANIKILIRRNGHSVYKPECSGAIINEYWILTAAHCFQGEKPTSFRVTVGDHHVTRTDDGEQEFEVSKIISHENYTRSSFDYDIALIKIKPGIKWNSLVQPVCLPSITDLPGNGREMMVSGWGRDKLSGPSFQPILKKTLMPLMGLKECSNLFKDHITPRMFCAGTENGPTDMCRGDSGGPAVYEFAGMYILYGLTSFGSDCAFPNYPVVFSNVRSYLGWIFKNLKLYSSNQREQTIPKRIRWSD